MSASVREQSNLKVAVVGGGVAGIMAAYLLQRRHAVTLFEQNDYVGGHTHTITVPDGDGVPVDIGFIVFNNKTYPNLLKFFAQLEVAYETSNMSFSYWDQSSGLQYAGTGFSGLFAQRMNLLRPSHWRFLRGIVNFCKRCLDDLHADRLGGVTLDEYLQRAGCSDAVIRNYILPMTAAIWSAPYDEMRKFPAVHFAHFFANHGLLALEDRPTWFYVKGGSQSYVKKFLAGFQGNVRTACGVTAVTRRDDGVEVSSPAGTERFDVVVMAAHADETLRMLADPDDDEKRLLGAWRYSDNLVSLHRDRALMPPNRRAWASWNYLHAAGAPPDAAATLTYHMNRLQRIPGPQDYLVTLNAPQPVAGEQLIYETTAQHPQYNFAAMDTQPRLGELNGRRRTWFCGSYFGYGFHEDAVRSSVAMAQDFGLTL